MPPDEAHVRYVTLPAGWKSPRLRLRGLREEPLGPRVRREPESTDYFLFTGECGSIRYATMWAICSGVRWPVVPRRGMFEHGKYNHAL